MADRLHHLGQLRRCRLRPDERGRRPVHQLPVHAAYAADRRPADRLPEGAHDAARVAARHQLRGLRGTPACAGHSPPTSPATTPPPQPQPRRARITPRCSTTRCLFRDGKNVYTEHFQTEANETDPQPAPVRPRLSSWTHPDSPTRAIPNEGGRAPGNICCSDSPA